MLAGFAGATALGAARSSLGALTGALLPGSVAARGEGSPRGRSSAAAMGSAPGRTADTGAEIGVRPAAGCCLASEELSLLALAISPTTMPRPATTANATPQRCADQLRNCATSPSVMELSLARATTADVDVGPLVGDEDASKRPAAPGVIGGWTLVERGALSGAASTGASAAFGVPSEVSVLRF